jgi:3-hydroxybutyryl-CoA dehydrogenase
VAVVGAGRMGRGIAIAFAGAGVDLDVIDLKPRSSPAWDDLARQAQQEVGSSLAMLAQLGALTPQAAAQAPSRVHWVGAQDGDAALARAEIVFEAVPETVAAKRDAFARICAHAAHDAILASTTSTLLVTALAEWVTHPERLINAHWLNPAYLMPLVELSAHARTLPSVHARLAALLERIGKVTVTCAASPGYIVPRLQALIMNEAARMIDEGVATAQDIDTATRYGLGLRFAALGVVEFIDVGGIDILHHASEHLSAHLSAPRYTAPPVVARMMQLGQTGLKSGQGFYDYRGIDLQAYRLDVMRRILGQVHHLKPPRGADSGTDCGAGSGTDQTNRRASPSL